MRNLRKAFLFELGAHLPIILRDDHTTSLEQRFPEKDFERKIFRERFSEKTPFEATGIQTHDLPTHVILSGHHLP